MSMNKVQMKKFLLSLLIFVAGAFSVSIANMFGGHFGIVVVVQVVSLTVYLNELLTDNSSLKNSLVELILIGVVLFLNLVFFVTNDIVGKSVYVGNLTNFWDITVIVSQLVSLGSLVYALVVFVLKSKIIHIEVVDYCDKNIEESNCQKVEKEEFEETATTSDVSEEVKSIVENNVKVETPFMEEEN